MTDVGTPPLPGPASGAAPDPAPNPVPGLGSVAAKGAFVTLAGQGARILVQLLSIVLLSRLLDPSDYGLMAMVTVVVGVGEVFRDFGLSSAAIQAKTLSRAQRDNLFWSNTAIGAVLSTVVLLSSGLVAAIYGRPELQAIAQVMAVSFLLNGLATQYRADLNRRLLFRRLTLVDVLAQVVGLTTGVVVAVVTGSYWALVAMQLSQGLAALLLVVAMGRWLPGRPRRGADMHGFYRFGWNLVGTQLVGYASNNLDTLVIGQRFGATSLGFYNRAFQLLMLPLAQVRAPTTTVALPVLSKLQDEEERYSAFLLRGQLALGYTLVAGVALAGGAADPLISLALGDRWERVVPLFTALAVAGVFQTLSYVGFWVYLSRGLTGPLLRYTLVSSAVRAVCILVGSQWGVLGVAVGYAVGPFLVWPLSLWWLARVAPIPLGGLVRGAVRVLLLSLTAAAVARVLVSVLAGLPDALLLVVAAVAGLAVYAFAALVVPTVRDDVRGLLDLARRVVSRSPRPEAA